MALPDHYPQAARDALERLIDGLKPAAPEPSALVVYGSLAKGTYRPGESDINLAVVLDRASMEVLGRIREPLRAAWRQALVSPFLLERGEIPRLVDAFPIKLADIKAHHHVITGSDPFIDISISPADLRLRVEQELRNHLIRLRRHYVNVGNEPRELGRMLYSSASSLGIELGALLRLTEHEPDDPSLEAVTTAAARAFDLDAAVLEQLCAFKRNDHQPDAHQLYAGVMTVLETAVHIADTLESHK